MRAWKGIAALSMLVLACCLVLGGASAYAGRSASFVVTPINGTPKSPITFYGAGFAPGEVIEIIMIVDGVPTELGIKPMIKKANEFGGFKVSGHIPRNAEPGIHTIQAIGDKGTTAVAPLEVMEQEVKK